MPKHNLTVVFIGLSTLQAGSLLTARNVWAQVEPVKVASEPTPAPAEPAPRRVVEIDLSGGAGDIAAVEKLLRELLVPYPVTIHWNRSESIDAATLLGRQPDQPEVLVRFWIDLGGQEEARVYVVEGASHTLLLRRIPARNGVDQVVRESIGQLVGSAVDALLAGGALGVQRPESFSPSSTNTGNATSNAVAEQSPYNNRLSSRTGLNLSFAIGYLAQGYASAAPLTHNLAALFLLTGAGRGWKPAGWFAIQYRFPQVLKPEPIGARFETAGARFFGGVSYREGRPLRWRLAAGGGADLVRVEPLVEKRSAAAPAAGRFRANPVLDAALHVQLDLGSSAALLLAAGAELPLVDVHYYEQRPAGPNTLLRPWLLQPWISVGMAFDIVPRASYR